MPYVFTIKRKNGLPVPDAMTMPRFGCIAITLPNIDSFKYFTTDYSARNIDRGRLIIRLRRLQFGCKVLKLVRNKSYNFSKSTVFRHHHDVYIYMFSTVFLLLSNVNSKMPTNGSKTAE